MTSNPYLWLIPVLPLAGAAINGVFGRRSSKKAITTIALAFCGAAFLLALKIAFGFSSADAPYYFDLAHWIRAGNFQADFSFYLDQLSLVMLLVVTGVGFLIHIYSVGYMWDDAGYYRFMSYLNLFMFFMLTLVLGANFLLLFVGWEGVGLCSYLLIGFYFLEQYATTAGNKAFIVNRIGDFGFTLAVSVLIGSRTEPGCISHAVHVDCENPLRLVFFEQWADRAALLAHFAVPASRDFVRSLQARAESATTIELYEATRLEKL